MIYRSVVEFLLTLFWRVKPRSLPSKTIYPVVESQSDSLHSLLQLLRKYPWWRFGHSELAELQLQNGDAPKAYISGVAMKQLAKSDSDLKAAHFVIGRAELQVGEVTRSIQTLLSALGNSECDYRVREELAAAYLANDEVEKAEAELRLIPEERISVTGKSVLSFCVRKRE